MAKERPGFLGRWARRKTEVLQGKPLEEPELETPVPLASPVPVPAAPAAPPAEQSEKMLSLDDVRQLTRDSDFTPFMARDVSPDVRNAAMKKLFTDPRYNVMDGLDIYIDDYSRADPIPEAMLRQMVGAKLLKIFDDEDDQPSPEGAAAPAPVDALPRVNLNNPTPETVAQSDDSPDSNSPKLLGPEPSRQQDDHAHPHLRLQPDHAAPAPDAGHGTA